jgi:hypothetical protein
MSDYSVRPFRLNGLRLVVPCMQPVRPACSLVLLWERAVVESPRGRPWAISPYGSGKDRQARGWGADRLARFNLLSHAVSEGTASLNRAARRGIAASFRTARLQPLTLRGGLPRTASGARIAAWLMR